MQFEFDNTKNQSNQEKHMLDFDWLDDGFDWDSLIFSIDNRQDYGEERFIGFGYFAGRLTCLVYTERDDVIRPISWRKANSREVKEYAKEVKGE